MPATPTGSPSPSARLTVLPTRGRLAGRGSSFTRRLPPWASSSGLSRGSAHGSTCSVTMAMNSKIAGRGSDPRDKPEDDVGVYSRGVSVRVVKTSCASSWPSRWSLDGMRLHFLAINLSGIRRVDLDTNSRGDFLAGPSSCAAKAAPREDFWSGLGRAHNAPARPQGPTRPEDGAVPASRPSSPGSFGGRPAFA